MSLHIETVSRGYAHEILEVLHEDGSPASYVETVKYFNTHPALHRFGSWIITGTNRIHYCTD